MAGRPRKYQEVDMEKAMKAQIDRACVLFGPPYIEMLPDEQERRSIREVAEIMGISAVKVRRLLIVGNHYMTPTVKAIANLKALPKLSLSSGNRRVLLLKA